MFDKQELIKSIKTIFEELIILDNFTILTDNGPYKDKELPLRFNCHLLIIGCFLLKKNLIKREQFIKLENFFSNLIQNNSNFGYKFRDSNKSKKDTVNGLIGPAWIAECLIYAGITLRKNDYLDEAIRLLKCHPYSNINKCWHRITPCGMILPIDYTFNHQLWFAEQCLKTKDAELVSHANTFLEHHIPKLSIFDNGVINHYTPIIKLFQRPSILNLTDIIYSYGHYILTDELKKNKSLAYQGFNLKSLASCYKLSNKALSCWSSKKFKKLKKFQISQQIHEKLKDSPYGYQYNPTIYELLFWFTICCPDNLKSLEKIIYFNKSYFKNISLEKNLLQKLRIYEAIDYLELHD